MLAAEPTRFVDHFGKHQGGLDRLEHLCLLVQDSIVRRAQSDDIREISPGPPFRHDLRDDLRAGAG